MPNSIEPDFTFERNDRTIRDYLFDLVSDDESEMLRAGDAIESMLSAVPSIDTDWSHLSTIPDLEEHQFRFRKRLQEVVLSKEFPTASWLSDLWSRNQEMERAFKAEVDASMNTPWDQKFERIADKIKSRLDDASKDESERLKRKLNQLSSRYLAGACQNLNGGFEKTEKLAHVKNGCLTILNLMDVEYLQNPALLETMLRESEWMALPIIERLGPLAREHFGKTLLDRLKKCRNKHGYFTPVQALAAMARNDDGLVKEILEVLSGNNPNTAAAAASVVQYLGLEVGSHQEGIKRQLIGMFRQTFPDPNYHVVMGLASIGRNDQSIRQQIVQLAKPKPPEIFEEHGYPVDRTMYRRSYAIDAIEFFHDYPKDCLPTLIDAVDSFEEYDPDMCYSGPCYRVASVLGSFGPSAKEAVDTMVEHLDDDPGEYPTGILEAIGEIGTCSLKALQTLKTFCYKWSETNDWEPGEPIDKDDDLGRWVVNRLETDRAEANRSGT